MNILRISTILVVLGIANLASAAAIYGPIFVPGGSGQPSYTPIGGGTGSGGSVTGSYVFNASQFASSDTTNISLNNGVYLTNAALFTSSNAAPVNTLGQLANGTIVKIANGSGAASVSPNVNQISTNGGKISIIDTPLLTNTVEYGSTIKSSPVGTNASLLQSFNGNVTEWWFLAPGETPYSGYAAPLSSISFYNGDLFIKMGAEDGDWAKVITESNINNYISGGSATNAVTTIKTNGTQVATGVTSLNFKNGTSTTVTSVDNGSGAVEVTVNSSASGSSGTNFQSVNISNILSVGILSPFPKPTRIAILGNSRAAGAGETPWPVWFTNLFATNGTVSVSNSAVSGQNIAQQTALYTNQVQPLKPSGGTNAIFIYFDHIVDIAAGATAADIELGLSNVWTLANQDGFTTIGVTAAELGDSYGVGEGPRQVLNVVNEWVLTNRITRGVLDVNATISAVNLVDGIHFYTDAHKVIAGNLYSTLLNLPYRRGSARFTGKFMRIDADGSTSYRGLSTGIILAGANAGLVIENAGAEGANFLPYSGGISVFAKGSAGNFSTESFKFNDTLFGFGVPVSSPFALSAMSVVATNGVQFGSGVWEKSSVSAATITNTWGWNFCSGSIGVATIQADFSTTSTLSYTNPCATNQTIQLTNICRNFNGMMVETIGTNFSVYFAAPPGVVIQWPFGVTNSLITNSSFNVFPVATNLIRITTQNFL